LIAAISFDVSVELTRAGCFIGEVPGHDYTLEILSKYYFHTALEDYGDLEEYWDTGFSKYNNEAQSILHPFKPIDVDSRKEESYEENYRTRDIVWTSTIWYDLIDFFCGRSNCPYCLKGDSDPFWKEAREELRHETTAYLKKLRKIMKISLLNTMIMTNMPDAS
jgi:hypothetical protein